MHYSYSELLKSNWHRILAAILAVMFLVVLPTSLAIAAQPNGNAGGWTEKVRIDAMAGVGGNKFFLSGIVVGSDNHAGGSIECYHPPGPGHDWELSMKLVNLQCLVVEETTHPTRPADHNVFVVGRLVVDIDSHDRVPDENKWGVFVYYPDDTRHGAARPFAFRSHYSKPSCDPDEYFNWTPDGVWHSVAYFLDGYVNVEVR